MRTILRLSVATLALSLTMPLQAQSTSQLSVADATFDEGAANWCAVVSRTGSTAKSAGFTYRTVDDSAISVVDYVARSGTQSVRKGTTKITICAALNDDSLYEGPERFLFEIGSPTNATIVRARAAITIGDNDAAPPPPPPPPVPEPTPLTGLPDIPSEFNPQLGLIPIPLARSAAPDTVGAFRFICTPGQLRYDDPIVYPGQPGKSHLHQFYGHEGADASSTYASLRATGTSTCARKLPLNRSAYWMPAMLDGLGNVVRPDYVAIYYKRRPKSDPKCSLTSGDLRAEGNCIELPNGLKFIFGYDMVTSTPPTGAAYFDCQGTGAISGHYSTIPNTVGKCVAGGKIGAIIKAPACWNGKDLDSANHRDHVAFAGYGTWGYLRCPKTHPYVIPGFTLQAWYSIAPGDDLSKWKFSSDDMHPELPHGSTFHADFFMAWDPTIKKMWHDNCIDKLLNCSAGDLGNGWMIDGAAVTGVTGGRVPVPAQP